PARRARAPAHPAAPVRPVVRRPPPARHVPRRVRLGPVHPHVRAGRGAPHTGVVLPLPPAPDRARPAHRAPGLRGDPPVDHRVQLFAPGRAGDDQPALRLPGEALVHRRRGDPVAAAGGDQALRRPRRRVRVQEPRRPVARRGAARARLGALPPGAAADGGPMTLSRRRLLRALALGGAAALARAIPARAAATPPEWASVVAAARKEGKVVVNTFPGDGYKRALKAFTQAYPDIKLEHTGLHSQDFAPRILQERQASLFTWDVAMIPTSTALQVLRPAGVWDPVRPAIVLPEALDDAGWQGGFARGFALVKDRALCYGFVAVRGARITVNTDLLKGEPVKGLTDLLNPKWKGKLLLPDVRVM